MILCGHKGRLGAHHSLPTRFPISLALGDIHRPVVIAMITMGVVQAGVALVVDHQVVDVVAMRDRLVSAAGPADMPAGIPRHRVGFVQRVTPVGVGVADLNGVLGHLAVLLVVQVPVVEVIDVPAVFHGGVPTPGAVLMGVITLMFVWVHDLPFAGACGTSPAESDLRLHRKVPTPGNEAQS